MEELKLRKVKLQDIYIDVEISGSGQPLLLIHGFPLNLEMWRPQIETLSSSLKVIAPDLRGHGQSPPTPGPYSMDLLSDDCAALLVELGIDEPVILGGLSMGGYVAFSFYRRHPTRVSKLILAATRAGADSPEVKVNRDKAVREINEIGPESVVENMLPIMMAPQTYADQPALVDRVRQIMLRTSAEGMVSALTGMKSRTDSTPILKEIKVPTLILHGADDQIVPLSESKAMQASISDSHLEVIPNAGHLLNLEQSKLFNNAVEKFITS
jgi:pimeloyl-ACP methyl ester carboxylesterase